MVETHNTAPTVFGEAFAHLGDFNYQVAIANPKGGHHCGGAIITSLWILTTAHCIPPEKWMTQFSVKVGMIDIDQGMEYPIISGFAHESSVKPGPPVNDIGLVKVGKEIHFSDFVKSIEISTDFVGDKIKGVVTGWGRYEEIPQDEWRFLKFSTMTTISNDECRSKWTPKIIEKGHLCTNGPGIGICHGDYGSPLAINGKLVGLGVFSLCKNGTADGFTRVSEYKDWIDTIIKNNS